MLLTPGQNHHTLNLCLTIYYIAPVAATYGSGAGETLRIDPTIPWWIALAQLLQNGTVVPNY
jgi:hypothetical protein